MTDFVQVKKCICGFEGTRYFYICISLGESSNGRKAVSKTVNGGSTPSSPVKPAIDEIAGFYIYFQLSLAEGMNVCYNSKSVQIEKKGNDMTADFAEPLLLWYDRNARELPWRQSKDPYRVWISEIMLQQTRAQAVIPYYERFLLSLPDVKALAACPDDELMKLWEGLGYYSRARNLKKAALVIEEKYEGRFPETEMFSGSWRVLPMIRGIFSSRR